MADPKRFILKDKLVTYIGAFVELYIWKNGRQVYDIHRMIEVKKMRALTIKNSGNLNAHQIIEISLVLHITHMFPKNQDKFMFYINSYIDWD